MNKTNLQSYISKAAANASGRLVCLLVMCKNLFYVTITVLRYENRRDNSL